jgi:predicted membrane channel-forming protein YqfA (hemolysin III family)
MAPFIFLAISSLLLVLALVLFLTGRLYRFVVWVKSKNVSLTDVFQYIGLLLLLVGTIVAVLLV